MKKISFTLMEVLLAMAIIGIIAGAVANQIKKVSADKVKLTFKNNYNHILNTVNAIASDENVLPAAYHRGYDSTTGKKIRLTFCNAVYSLDNAGNTVSDFNIFPRAFLERTGNVVSSEIISSPAGYRFTTKNGSYWVVRRNPESMVCRIKDVDNAKESDFVIIFDIDGINQGSNCPYTGENLNEVVADSSICSNPDTFKFGVTINNKVVPDKVQGLYDGEMMSDYLKEHNFIQDKF